MASIDDLPDRWQKRAELFLIAIILAVAASIPHTVDWILENGKGVVG